MTLTSSPDTVMDQLTADLAGTLGVLLTSLGTRTGLWAALDGAGPLTPDELADRVTVAPALVREWLRAQAAAGYLRHDDGRFALPDAVALEVVHGPGGAMVEACTRMLVSMAAGFDEFAEAFGSGRGYGWDRRTSDFWHGSDLLTRTVLPAELIGAALDQLGVAADAAVLDVGCGYGSPTVAMAQHLGTGRVLGIDFHGRSIEAARLAAKLAGVADRVRFEVAAATDVPGSGYQLVTFFDSLHDLGDPVGALIAAREALAPDGRVLLVEPLAADAVDDNLHPGGRMFYSVSTLVCTPNAVSQQVPGGVAPLGTLAGEARLREIAAAAGFARVRRLDVEGPVNLLLELQA
ncbi:MAG: cyclopropane-fatty-acyl-phospholipid synthase family protein [Mycobacteriales bacterium]